MGTRHIISVKKDNQFKVFNYGQWDGYPAGQGKDILNLLSSQNIKKLSDNLEHVEYVSDAQYQQLWLNIGVDLEACNGMVSMDKSDEFKDLYPQFSRDMGADIITYLIETEKPLLLPPSLGNGMVGTWCEWFYVIDLDENELAVFDSPMFFYDGNEEVEIEEEKVIYNRKKNVASFKLDDLPHEIDFLAAFNE